MCYLLIAVLSWSRLAGIQAKQITIENIYENKTQQWRLHQWTWRSNQHLKMVPTLSAYTARFATWFYRYNPNEAKKPGYEQLHIYDSAEATTKRLENQSDPK
jgi:hypothetical protein